MSRRLSTPLLAIAAAACLSGCGSSSKQPAAAATTTSTPPTATTAPATGPGALTPEANATAAGDIPDNQIFLTFADAAAGYSLKYPEGWAQQGSGTTVTFRDKNNIIRVVVSNGKAAPTATPPGAQLRGTAHRVSLPGAGPATKLVYTTISAPNPVTGKRVTLVVDRYVLTHGGKVATVDLGAPAGVDNVDAYRLISQSFRWH